MSVLAPFTTQLLDRRAPSPVERRFTMLLTANVDLTTDTDRANERTKGELRRGRARRSRQQQPVPRARASGNTVVGGGGARLVAWSKAVAP